MPAYNTLAIVLRRLHYGETDNILTLYARDHGRLSAIAKGARKAISRLSGATEVLTCTRFQLATGKSLDIVTQCEIENAFSALREDLPRLAHGLYLADLLSHSVEDNLPNPLLFDLLQTGLSLIESVPDPQIVARWFELHLLHDLGYAPDLRACAVCQTPLPGEFTADEQFALSAALGGALCPRHALPTRNDDHSALSYDAFGLLLVLAALGPNGGAALTQLPLPDAKSLDEARLALRRTLRYRLERDLKSLTFLDSLRH